MPAPSSRRRFRSTAYSCRLINPSGATIATPISGACCPTRSSMRCSRTRPGAFYWNARWSLPCVTISQSAFRHSGPPVDFQGSAASQWPHLPRQRQDLTANGAACQARKRPEAWRLVSGRPLAVFRGGSEGKGSPRHIQHQASSAPRAAKYSRSMILLGTKTRNRVTGMACATASGTAAGAHLIWGLPSNRSAPALGGLRNDPATISQNA